MYKLTFIVRNEINDTQYASTIEEVHREIRDCSYECAGLLDDFFDHYYHHFSTDLITLKAGGCLIVPFINEDADYGALVIEKMDESVEED